MFSAELAVIWQVHRVKAKELNDLKKSYKEAMDELNTLRTKVGSKTQERPRDWGGGVV